MPSILLYFTLILMALFLNFSIVPAIKYSWILKALQFKVVQFMVKTMAKAKKVAKVAK